jgi:3-oxoadipate enol-lactonase
LIVLVNGLFATQASWQGVLDYLLPHFSAVTFDGRGQSPEFRPDGPYTLKTLGDDLAMVVDRLEESGVKASDQQVCVLGLSNGGRVALDFASRYSSKVQTLVVADTYNRLNEALRLKLNSWLAASRQGGPAHRFDVATPWVWGESFLRSQGHVLQSYRERASYFDHEMTKKLIDCALDGEIELGKIQCPTLVMVGEEDVLTPLSHHMAITRELKRGKLEIIRGGHASLLEYPETIEQVVLPFLLGEGQ